MKVLFRKAIGGNEHTLVQEIAVEGTGLWTHLQARKVLTEQQIQICKRQVCEKYLLLIITTVYNQYTCQLTIIRNLSCSVDYWIDLVF